MKAILTALSLVVATLVSACGTTGASSGDIAAFARPTVNGDKFDLSQHLGKDVVLVSFWTTYCEPCKTEMPFLQQFHDKYGAEGFRVVSVSMDGPDTVAEVLPYVRRMGYTYPIVVDEDGAIAQRMNPVAAAPFAILVGRDGKVRQRFSGFKAGEAQLLENAIVAALKDGKAPTEAAPTEATPTEATPTEAAPTEAAPATETPEAETTP